MKPEILFMAAVVGLAGLHLLFSLVNFLSKFKETRAQESLKAKTRDDWYVFFKKSDLCGDLTDTVAQPEVVSEKTIESDTTCNESVHQEAYA